MAYNYMAFYWDELHEDVRDGITANKRNGVSGRSGCGCRVESGVEGWVLCPHHQRMQTGG